MKKAEMVEKILADMEAKNDAALAVIERRWKAWLSRQSKAELAEIMKNRKIG